MKNELLSMSQASKICPYEQGYLSLLARRGELKAEKVGRNWFTTVEWLNDYLKEKKPNDVITEKPVYEKKPEDARKTIAEMVKIKWFMGMFLLALIFAGFFVFRYILTRVDSLEEKSKNNEFITDEIIKIPDDEGNYDVYGKGSLKIGKEKNLGANPNP